MEKYVVSRGIAEKLKESGFPQESKFYWHSLISHDMQRWSEYKLQDYKPDSNFGMKVLAAPLAEELIHAEGMPMGIITHYDNVDGHVVYYGGMSFRGSWRNPDITNAYAWEQSLANALAELWLWNNKVTTEA